MKTLTLTILAAAVAGACTARQVVRSHHETDPVQRLVELDRAHLGGWVSSAQYERRRRLLLAEANRARR